MGTFSEDYKEKRAAGYMLKGGAIPFLVYHVDGVPIEELNLSQRSYNGLKRSQIMTVDDVLSTDLGKVRNLGVKSIREIKNAVLNYSYDRMTESQKREFWANILI